MLAAVFGLLDAGNGCLERIIICLEQVYECPAQIEAGENRVNSFFNFFWDYALARRTKELARFMPERRRPAGVLLEKPAGGTPTLPGGLSKAQSQFSSLFFDHLCLAAFWAFFTRLSL